MSIQQTAISGLLTAQRALSITSHNISNVNTPGYSRQLVEVSAREASLMGSGYVGNGVEINRILRAHDSFLTNQLRSSIASENEASTFLFLASRIDGMLAKEETGLTISLQNFFNSVQDVSDQPSFIAARQVMLSEADSLTSRFQFLDSRMSDLSEEIRTLFINDVRDVNSLIGGISQINDRIVKAMGQSDGGAPNDLMDMRDKLIEDLSHYVNVNAVDQFDGSVNIFVGNGQPLVLGSRASQISANESYSGHFDITLASEFGTSDITDQIQGGSMAGTLSFQNDMLEPARNSLGRLALGLVDSFNSQHALGQSLDGDINQNFFSVGGPDVLPVGSAPNNVTASIIDSKVLSNSDYSLVYNGADNYTLTRNSDGQTTTINTGGAAVFVTAPVDGFTLNISTGAAINDKFIVRPSINGAGTISTNLSDPRKIAAAAALRSSVVTNASGLPLNTGNAAIGEVNISSLAGVPLATPITLTFDAVLNQFNVSAPPGGTLPYNPLTESGGKQFSLAAVGDATFSISGNPANGDQFVIENNINASGDNQNALNLASLQTGSILLGGTSSYQDSYGQLVAEVGTTTRQTQISNEALSALKAQALAARDSVSGVNLEEEAGNMLKYQQAFQAAAQMVSTADRLFQTIMEALN